MRSWKRKHIVCASLPSPDIPLSYYELDPWSCTPQMILLIRLYQSSWSDVFHTLECEDHHSTPACSAQLQWKGEMEEPPSTLTSVKKSWTSAKNPVNPSLSSVHTARLEQNLSSHKFSVTAHTAPCLWCDSHLKRQQDSLTLAILPQLQLPKHQNYKIQTEFPWLLSGATPSSPATTLQCSSGPCGLLGWPGFVDRLLLMKCSFPLNEVSDAFTGWISNCSDPSWM